MRKTAIAGIGTILIIFLILIVHAQEERAPVFPVQVFGSITPAIPDNHVVYFKINNLEYGSANIIGSKYGYEPLLLIPADDAGTSDKEGYAADDAVGIYIDSVKVKDAANLISPQRMDIALATGQYNAILGITPQPQPTQTATRSGGGGGCFYRWNCSDWGACLQNGTQLKSCINTGTCSPKSKTMYQNCSYAAPFVEQPVVPTTPVYQPPAAQPAYTPPEEEKRFTMISYIIIAVIAAAVFGGLGFVVYEAKRSHKALKREMKQKQISEDSFANLRNYVKQMLDGGYSKEQIRAALMQEGWQQRIISDVLR